MSAMLLIIPRREVHKSESSLPNFTDFRKNMGERARGLFGPNVESRPIWRTPPLLGHTPLLALWYSKSASGKLYEEVGSRWVVVWAGFSGPNDLSVCH